MERTAPRVGTAAIDAAILAGMSLTLLWAVPIGWFSGDAIALSARFENGTWQLNPNHLLLEPISAWWYELVSALKVPRRGPDALKLLSILAGAVSIFLFRRFVATRAGAGRRQANLGTAWFALGAAFSGLWISGETHMLQMPFLVLAAAALLSYLRDPSKRSGAWVGIWAGVGALVYISNIIIASAAALAAGIYHTKRGSVRLGVLSLFLIGGAAALVTFGGAVVGWWLVAKEEVGFLRWVSSYGGGAVADRVSDSYGVGLSFGDLAAATARALYGAANTVVDVSAVVEVVRDGAPVGLIHVATLLAFACGTAALAIASVHLVRQHAASAEPALLVAVSWTVAVLGFGVYWNNSDSQFYFQLAVPLGVVIAAYVPRLSYLPRSVVLGLSSVCLLWNTYILIDQRILYPRAELSDMLATELASADLIVIPGQEEVDHLIRLAGGPSFGEVLSITALHSRFEPATGMQLLGDSVRHTLDRGGRVEVVSIFDVPANRQPWKALRRAGYELEAVQRVLSVFPIDDSSRGAGSPFTFRTIRPGR